MDQNVPPAAPQQYAPSAPMPTPLTFEDIYPLVSAKGWLKFVGTLNIIVGVIYCITIIGAIFGWLPIWLGVVCNRAGNCLGDGYRQQSGMIIREVARKLGTAITIVGVLALIGLIINVLYIFVLIIMLVVGAMSGGF